MFTSLWLLIINVDPSLSTNTQWQSVAPSCHRKVQGEPPALLTGSCPRGSPQASSRCIQRAPGDQWKVIDCNPKAEEVAMRAEIVFLYIPCLWQNPITPDFRPSEFEWRPKKTFLSAAPDRSSQLTRPGWVLRHDNEHRQHPAHPRIQAKISLPTNTWICWWDQSY